MMKSHVVNNDNDFRLVAILIEHFLKMPLEAPVVTPLMECDGYLTRFVIITSHGSFPLPSTLLTAHYRLNPFLAPLIANSGRI